VTGGRRTPSRPAPGHSGLFTIWALHDKVHRWVPIVTGMPGPAAVAELTLRQDRLRRRDEPCRMILLEDGKVPQ
jgi:hypothetical protein